MANQATPSFAGLGVKQFGTFSPPPSTDKWWERERFKNSPWSKVARLTDFNSQTKYHHLDGDRLEPLLRTRGVRAGIPTPVAHVLLTHVKAAKPMPGLIGGVTFAYQLESLGLFHKVPAIMGRRKSSYRTSSAGFDLMDYWLRTDKKFQPFYDAYVSQKDREACISWTTMLAMGIEPPEITDANAQNAKIMEEQRKAEAAENARQMQWQKQQLDYAKLLKQKQDNYQNQIMGSGQQADCSLTNIFGKFKI